MACAGNNGRADVGESGSSEAGDVGVDVSAFVLAAQIQQSPAVSQRDPRAGQARR